MQRKLDYEYSFLALFFTLLPPAETGHPYDPTMKQIRLKFLVQLVRILRARPLPLHGMPQKELEVFSRTDSENFLARLLTMADLKDWNFVQDLLQSFWRLGEETEKLVRKIKKQPLLPASGFMGISTLDADIGILQLEALGTTVPETPRQSLSNSISGSKYSNLSMSSTRALMDAKDSTVRRAGQSRWQRLKKA